MKTRFYSFLLFVFVIVSIGLGSWGLTESSEARYAEIPREMVKTGDFIHPRLMEIQHFHKPPLAYWITAVGYKIFGINEFGARIFLQVALIVQLLLVFKLAMLLFKNEKIAFSSAVIFFTFPIVLIATRNLTTDAYLTTVVLGSIYSWLVYKLKSKTFYLYLCYFLMGLGFLLKGPVIILPVLAFTIPWKIIYKDKFRISIHHILGFLLFALVSASWFIVIIRETPELWNYFFMKHTVDRALDADTFHRSKPFWYFFAYGPMVGIPWFIFTIIMIFRRFKGIEAVDKKNLKVLLWSAGAVFLLFSLFSSKLILYILPVYPLVAVIAGYLWKETSEKWLKYYINTYLVLFLLFLVTLPVLKFMNVISLSVLSIGILFAIAAIGVFYFLKYSKQSREIRLLGLGVVFTVCMLLAFAFVGNQNPYMINTTKQLAEEIKNEELDGVRNILVYDYRLPSIQFYLDRPVITVHKDDFNAKREVLFEKDDAYKDTYIDIENPEDYNRFEEFLKKNDNILILRRNRNLPDSLKSHLDHYKMKEAGKWKIYY